MDPAVIEGHSLPLQNFFFYKDYIVGCVKVKVNNFESILRSKHTYPILKLKLCLKKECASLYMEDDNSKSKRTVFELKRLE